MLSRTDLVLTFTVTCNIGADVLTPAQVDAGADLQTKDDDGDTALDNARNSAREASSCRSVNLWAFCCALQKRTPLCKMLAVQNAYFPLVSVKVLVFIVVVPYRDGRPYDSWQTANALAEMLQAVGANS